MITNIPKLQLSFSFAIKALLENKFRAMLTALGIIFGVAAVIAMLAIGKGAEKEILDQISRVGSNNIIIEKKIPNAKDDEGGNSGYNMSNGLTMDDVNGISAIIPKIKDISPELSYESFVLYGSRSSNMRLVGVYETYFTMFNYQLKEGRFFTLNHRLSSQPVCVIGQGVKKKLFGNEDPIGKKIKCGNAWFEVVGVIQTSTSEEDESEILGIRNADNDIYLPITSLLLRYKNKNLITKKTVEQANNAGNDDNESEEKAPVDYHQIDKIIIQIQHTEQLKQIAEITSRYLYRVHSEIFDFEIHIPELLLKQQQRSKAIFNIVLGVIAGISLLVGGIGIMNIMLATVMERIKEIGVRMAIGASEKDIVLQFVMESVLLSISGGIAGIFLGLIITYAIEQITGILTIVTLYSVLLSFGVSAMIGIVFGIMPAKKAAKQDPIVSLRN